MASDDRDSASMPVPTTNCNCLQLLTSDQANCWLPLPAQSFLFLSPGGLMAIFYCLMTLGVMRCNSLGMDHTENTVSSNSSSVVVCWFVSAETCLSRHCLAMSTPLCSTLQAVNYHVTISTFIWEIYIHCPFCYRKEFCFILIWIPWPYSRCVTW
jgi:hypothetical protein